MSDFLQLLQAVGGAGTGVLAILAFTFVCLRWGIIPALKLLGIRKTAEKLDDSTSLKKLNGGGPAKAEIETAVVEAMKKFHCPYSMANGKPLTKDEVVEAATAAVKNGIGELLVSNPRLLEHYSSTDGITPALKEVADAVKYVGQRIADFDNILSNQVQSALTDRDISSKRMGEIRETLRSMDRSLAVLADRNK